MFQAIDFVSYPTQDLERAVAFYRDTLGLKVFSHTEGKWAELELPNGHTITLYPFAAMGDETFTPAKSLALLVDDVAAAVKALAARGVSFPFGAEAQDSGVCHGAPILDSEGNLIYLHRRYKPE